MAHDCQAARAIQLARKGKELFDQKKKGKELFYSHFFFPMKDAAPHC